VSKGGNVKDSPQKMRLKGMEFIIMTQRFSDSSDSGPHTYDILMSGFSHLSQMPKYEGPHVNMSTGQGTPQQK